MKRSVLAIMLFAACLGWAVPRGFAQASELEKGPPPPPPEASKSTTPASTPLDLSSDPEPPKPQWDPLGAHKNIEVGSYYLKTGNYNAAIDRFREAASQQAGLAEPFRLLGRAYEKKHDPKDAVDAYRKYLNLYRDAPDSGEISKQIEKLTDEIQRQAKK